MSSLRLAHAYLRKDLLESMSHRGRWIFAILGMFVTLLVLSGNARFVGEAFSERLPAQAGGYLGYLILGVAVLSFHDTLVRELPRRIRQAQTEGTLEAVLGARGDLWSVIACVSIFPLAATSLRVAGLLGLGAAAFGLSLAWENLPFVLPILALASISFVAIGLLFSAAILAGARAEPLLALYGTTSALLGGVFFPAEVLPSWIAWGADAVPLRHVLGPVRAALSGGEFDAVAPCVTLAVAGSVLLPLALVSLGFALRRAMREGTLSP